MILVRCTKLIVFGMCFVPMSFGALGTGLLFGQFLTASSRNPVEYEKMYGTCLTAFALIETFSFLALVVAFVSTLFI